MTNSLLLTFCFPRIPGFFFQGDRLFVADFLFSSGFLGDWLVVADWLSPVLGFPASRANVHPRLTLPYGVTNFRTFGATDSGDWLCFCPLTLTRLRLGLTPPAGLTVEQGTHVLMSWPGHGTSCHSQTCQKHINNKEKGLLSDFKWQSKL